MSGQEFINLLIDNGIVPPNTTHMQLSVGVDDIGVEMSYFVSLDGGAAVNITNALRVAK